MSLATEYTSSGDEFISLSSAIRPIAWARSVAVPHIASVVVAVSKSGFAALGEGASVGAFGAWWHPEADRRSNSIAERIVKLVICGWWQETSQRSTL
jgi:hypothetical protein